MRRTGLILAAVAILFTATTTHAGIVQQEEERLAELRDTEYRRCTSPECRSDAEAKYNAAVAKLRRDPDYYFATVDREREIEERLDLNSDPAVRKRCLARWPDDYSMAEFCIRKQLMAKRRLNN